MDVFYVTDRDGEKVTDEATLNYIQTTLESDDCYYTEARDNSADIVPSESEEDSHQYSSIELTGTDRPGLLSEVCAVLSDVRCAVVSADLWTCNTRVAAVVQVADAATGVAISADPARVAEISRRLAHLLRSRSWCHATVAASVAEEPSLVAMHKERRLHQLMAADPESGVIEGDGAYLQPAPGTTPATVVEVTDCAQRGYTFVVVRCRDVPKLLFDTVCTITDAQYVVYHGNVSTEPDGVTAYQEYYVRNKAGLAATEPERLLLKRQLEAAVERRFADGIELEVRSGDRAGLLSDVTRIIRENGLTILRAGVKSQGGEAVDTFYVSDPMGLDYPVEPRTIDTIRAQIGEATLRVKKNPFADADQQQQQHDAAASVVGAIAFILGSVYKFYRPFQSLALVKLY
ncbi:hypothetical protein BRADI_5g08340v3 [Brachypodium distachyon]|nr:hypothetical protein BRADI_5g08340v3 [Brachypodium distachyon]